MTLIFASMVQSPAAGSWLTRSGLLAGSLTTKWQTPVYNQKLLQVAK